MDSLIKKLNEYKNKDIIPLHMPGGKRNNDLIRLDEPFSFDITEIDGFDNLHRAEGILQYEMQRISDIYRSDESLISVNGSTGAIISAICGAAQKNDKVLVARNCHISIINALYLRELNPVFLYPRRDEYGIYMGISLNEIKDSIEAHPEIKTVILTSPAYEGIVSETALIAEYLHEKGIILIVDEAHGAHFPFSEDFPDSSAFTGADAVINSIHKTLPALTQTALLHLNGKLIDKEKVRAFWNMLQTTSPSYVLMGSISACFDFVQSDKGAKAFKHYTENLKKLRTRIENELENIRLFPSDDISKIVLLTSDGKQLYDELLNGYGIQLEMAASNFVLAMTSVADKDEYYIRFFYALKELDKKLKPFVDKEKAYAYSGQSRQSILPLSEAFEKSFSQGKYIDIKKAAGKVAAETIVIYPPGTPLVAAGELITEEDIGYISMAYEKGFSVLGVKKDNNIICIKVM